MSDASHGTYRTLEEVEENKKNDPIGKLCSRLLDDGILDHAEIEDLDTEIIAEVEDAVTFAEASPDPDPGDLFADVYHN